MRRSAGRREIWSAPPNAICFAEALLEKHLSNAELEAFSSLSWEEVAPRLSARVRSALERVLEKRDGAALQAPEALELSLCEGDDLLGLLVAADCLRKTLVGDVVTYVVNRNINRSEER